MTLGCAHYIDVRTYVLPAQTGIKSLTRGSPVIRALVSDFDGLILDTEIPVLESWRKVYEDHGVVLPMDTWMETIGTADHDFDPFGHLQDLVGRTLECEPIHAARIEWGYSNRLVDLCLVTASATAGR